MLRGNLKIHTAVYEEESLLQRIGFIGGCWVVI